MKIKNNSSKMTNEELPSNLIFPDSEINIYYENGISVNKTSSAIIIEGTPNGFMSLANLINAFNSYLFEEIIITDFSFVRSNLKFSIIEKFDSGLPISYVVRQGIDIFKWIISEAKLYEIICQIHSLGYANNELHLDSNLQQEDISVYCVTK